MQPATDTTTELPPRVMIGHVIRATCIECKVSKADLIGPRRHVNLVLPRQIGMYVAKELTGTSIAAIGRAFGDRDHTTALHGVRKIAGLIDFDPRLRADLAAVRARAIRLAGGPSDPPGASVTPEVEIVEVDIAPAPIEQKAELTPVEAFEAKRLKGRGWSVFGLSRRYGVPVEIVCEAVGEREWKRAAA